MAAASAAAAAPAAALGAVALAAAAAGLLHRLPVPAAPVLLRIPAGRSWTGFPPEALQFSAAFSQLVKK